MAAVIPYIGLTDKDGNRINPNQLKKSNVDIGNTTIAVDSGAGLPTNDNVNLNANEDLMFKSSLINSTNQDHNDNEILTETSDDTPSYLADKNTFTVTAGNDVALKQQNTFLTILGIIAILIIVIITITAIKNK